MSKFCTQCGNSVEDGVKFCTACGAPIAEDKKNEAAPEKQPEPQTAKQVEERPPVAAAVVSPVQPQYTAPQPQPQYRQPQYQPPVQQQYQQPQYQQTQYQQQQYQPRPANDVEPSPDSKYAPVSTGGYVGMLILFAIPIVGFIFMIVWACGGSNNVNRVHYARAVLILTIIGIVLSIIVSIIAAVVGASVFDAIQYGSWNY